MPLEPLAGGDPTDIGGYRLRGRLGAGGMGVVYLAFTALGRPVAVKVVRPDLGDDPDFRARFRQEVAAARRVSGLFTAQVLDADPEGTPPWLVTAYVSGPSLTQAVAVRGPLPVPSVLWLLRGVAEALSAIHGADVVHRDLKPSNVLLAADGPRVIDFGIARAAETTALTRTGMRVGSPQYMSPEQARGDLVTPAADMWALGALGCFAVTGHAPFGEGGGEAAVLYRVLHEEPDLRNCPPVLAGVLRACLARDPATRPTPAQVIERCRTLEIAMTPDGTGSWLPPGLTADLALYAPPSATASPPTASPPTVPPQPVPPQPVPPSQQPTVSGLAVPPPGVAGPGMPSAATSPGVPPPGYTGPSYRPPYAPPTATSTVPAGMPGVSMPGAGLPGAGVAPGGAVPSRHRWLGLPDWAVAVGALAAVVVLVLAAFGIAALVSGGSTSSGASGGSAGGTGPAGNGSGPSVAASNSPRSSSGLDSCVFGTWRQSLEEVLGTINGNSVLFSGGSGVIQVFTSDGINTLNYGSDTTYTAEVDGDEWSQVITGTATVAYTTQDGMMLFSDVVTQGTLALYDNGIYNNGGPLTLNTQPERYTCTKTSLHLFVPDGGSIDLVRD